MPFVYCIFIFIFLNLTIFSAFAGQESTKNLQKISNNFLEKFKDKDHLTGIAITLSCPNSQPVSVYSGNVTPKNLWQIGSITKAFTAIVILQLETQNKFNVGKNNLGIKTPFGDIQKKYDPENFKKGLYSKWKNITLEQLLNMTSGIPEYFDSDDKFRKYFSKNPNKFYSLQDILSYEKNKKLDFSPGSSWNYSDTGYILLGYIIKIITNNDPGFEIKKRVIDKINLKNTYYVIDEPKYPYKLRNKNYSGPNLTKNLMVGYYWEDSEKHPPLFRKGSNVTNISLSAAGTAGSIISTTDDIDTFVRKLFTTNELLSAEQKKKLLKFVSMKTGQPIINFKNSDDWFGLGVAGYYDSKKHAIIIKYNGATYGYISGYRYVPNTGLIVTAIINTTKDSAHRHIKEEVFEKILNQYLDFCKN